MHVNLIVQHDEAHSCATDRGGLHLLFSSQPRQTVSLPKVTPGDARPVDVRYLIQWMKDEILSERVEMFGDGDGV